MSGSTSATLLGRLRDLGDGQAWHEFETRYKPRLLAWCRGQGLQEADVLDITQDVLTRVARRMRTFEYAPGGNFSGWLRTVWRNAWLSFLEDAGRRVQGAGGSTIRDQLEKLPGGDLTQELEEEFRRELVHEALQRLRPQVSARDWDLFSDLLLKGKSATAAAKERGMTLAGVGMAKLRVQRKLQREIGRLEGLEAEKEDRP
jgi:RNA polymerase sigma factor (sigma-70 family)